MTFSVSENSFVKPQITVTQRLTMEFYFVQIFWGTD